MIQMISHMLFAALMSNPAIAQVDLSRESVLSQINSLDFKTQQVLLLEQGVQLTQAATTVLDQKTYSVTREIFIQTEIKEMQGSGVDWSKQVGGVGDISVTTGGMKFVEGSQIQDLFGYFRGRFGNFGLLLAGGGYHQAQNGQGTLIYDLNYSTGIGSREGMGINFGVSAMGYNFVLVPVGKSALVKLSLHAKDSSSASVNSALGEISFDQIFSSKLVTK